MKYSKKHPKANLENYSKLFVQLGLVLTLGIVYLLIQNKTFTNEIIVLDNSTIVNSLETASNVEYQIEPPKEKPKQLNVILDVIKKVDNSEDVPVFVIKNQDPEAPVEISDIPKLEMEEELNPKDEVFDVKFMEEPPMYPGCKGTVEELKICLSEKIGKFVNRNFNADLAAELGLSPGIQKIHTVFKIDTNGNVIDVQARAPHLSLQKETIRVINSLPKMVPGKHNGKIVKVRYSMPITFKVQ